MKMSWMSAAALLPVLAGVSCTNLCQTVADWGEEYSGVEVTEPQVYYSHGGKKYVKGQRAKFRRVFTDHPYAIAKPWPDKFEPIAGTREGEDLYREVYYGKGQWQATYTEDSEWKPMQLKNPQQFPKDRELYRTLTLDHNSRRATAHALYAYPLAALTFVAVDLPLNVTALAVTGVVAIPTIPLIMASPQQQQTPPEPEPDKEQP